MEAAGKAKQVGESFNNNNSNNNDNDNAERQRQLENMGELFQEEAPSSYIREMTRPGISSEDQRRVFNDLMDHVDAQLTARGIGFQRRTSDNRSNNTQVLNGRPNGTCEHSVGETSQTQAPPDTRPEAGSSTLNPILICDVVEERNNSAGDVASNDDQAPVPTEAGASSNANTIHPSTASTFATAVAGLPVTISNQPSNAPPGVMTNPSAARPRENELFQRNVRFRPNSYLHEFIPMNNSTLARNAPVQPFISQPAIFSPYDHFARPPASHRFQNQQVQGSTMPGGRGVASAPPYPQLQQGNNIPRNVMYPAAQFERGSSSGIAPSMNFANGSTNIIPGSNNSTAAQNNPTPGHPDSRISAVPIWFPDQAINYSNRMLQVLRGAQSTVLQGDYRPLHAAAAGDNTRHRPGTSRLTGQEVDHPGRPFQPHSYGLALVHRDGRLRVEGVAGNNNPSMIINVHEEEDEDDEAEEEDGHEDMRLDIDAMTYEELLELEDEIGQVSTGVREEAILAWLRVHRYEAPKAESSDNNALCCICQEEYVNGEHIGTLDCGHDFHASCIKLWLMQKNTCPVCKMTGLACKQTQS